MATCVFQEPDLIERTVRDFLTEDVERIVVDNPKAHDRMREMISKISKRFRQQGQALHRGAADL
jgi:ribonuclease G